jgi:quercetin dioxygenase-like cupin family protein
MDTPYTLISDLVRELQPPAKGILSRTLHASDRLKAVGFGFAVGEELSEHTASFPAIIHILSGDATVTLGPDRHELTGGAWMHMAPKLPHSIQAKTPVTMLLLLLK